VRDTGFPRADAEADFLRSRRHQRLSHAARRLGAGGADVPLAFDDVVGALGARGERHLGHRVIAVDAVVGSVDKVRDFDPRFRPRSGGSRQRWERIAEAARRGEPLPPIDVYQVGEMYFVRDGHHRLSVYRALGIPTIEADVTRVWTLLTPDNVATPGDLTRKEARRVMLERVPLDPTTRRAVKVTDADDYARLAGAAEAWAARLVFATGAALTREEAARRWHDEEFAPALAALREAGFASPDERGGDAYLRAVAARDRLPAREDRRLPWGPELVERLAAREPSARSGEPGVTRASRRRRRSGARG
jgi:hypothetical protein